MFAVAYVTRCQTAFTLKGVEDHNLGLGIWLLAFTTAPRDTCSESSGPDIYIAL